MDDDEICEINEESDGYDTNDEKESQNAKLKSFSSKRSSRIQKKRMMPAARTYLKNWETWPELKGIPI